MSTTDLVTPNSPCVIKNDRQVECRYCKKVHEFITHKCRPVVFINPDIMRLRIPYVTVTDTYRDLDISTPRLGTPLALSEWEALSLDPEYKMRPHNKETD